MKSYRDFVMKGFYRGLSEIINRGVGCEVDRYTLSLWIETGAKNRPLQIGSTVVALVRRDIVIYSWRHTIGVPIPDVVWKVWPRNILGGRI